MRSLLPPTWQVAVPILSWGGNWQAELAKIDNVTPEMKEQAHAEWQVRNQQVLEAGGLHIIGSERHESQLERGLVVASALGYIGSRFRQARLFLPKIFRFSRSLFR